MFSFKRPMKAASLMPTGVEHTDANILAAMSKLKYPIIATRKWDGIRAVIGKNGLFSQRLKKIPNKLLQEKAVSHWSGLDLELCKDGMEYNDVQSIVMSEEHEFSTEIEFKVLDNWSYESHWGYEHRLGFLTDDGLLSDRDYTNIINASFLFDFFKYSEANNWEGICFRTPDSPYKQGRSTLKEQYLVKLSRYVRAEAKVIGFEEQLENCNNKSRNAIGYAERSSHTSAMIPKGKLGALICWYNDMIIRVGTGFTDAERKKIWLNREAYIDKWFTFKSKPFGVKDKPRHSVFVGWREKGF